MPSKPVIRNVTKCLKFSNPHFNEGIDKGVSNCQDQPDKTFLPDDVTMALLAKATYKYKRGNTNIDLPRGWKLLTTAVNKKDGYFGAAYINENKVVIAHRGTKFNNIKALLTDIHGIIYNQFTNQMDSACSFVAWVIDRLNLSTTSISLTGHSLGAWLAQITTFSIKYLNMNENGFSKKELECKSFQPHTVVFDSPGCSEMLIKLSENYFSRYENKVCYLINSLDIKTYLSAPNLINTCNKHIGVLLRVYPKLPDWAKDWKGFTGKLFAASHEAIMYSLENHGIKGFSEETLKCTKKILDWPLVTWPSGTNKKVSLSNSIIINALNLVRKIPDLIVDKLFNLNNNEYKKFFKFANSDNAYDPTIPITAETDDVILHYKVIPHDKNQCNITIFSEDELTYLESLLFLKDKNIQPINLMSLPGYDLENHERVFKTFRFSVVNCEKIIICDSENSLNSVINHTKLSLLHFPQLKDIIQSAILNIPDGFKSLLHSKTTDYLFFNQILSNDNDYEDTIHLDVFLKSVGTNVLYIHTAFSDLSLEPRRIHGILKLLRSKSSNKYDEEMDFWFLNWFQIIDLKKIGLINSLHGINLLVLDCQLLYIDDLELLKNLVRIVKKTIIIAHLKGPNVNLAERGINIMEYKTKELTWQDFTEIGQKNLLQKYLVVLHNQKRKISFGELIGIDWENKWTSIKLGEMFDSEVIAKLLGNEVINIGQPYLHFSNLNSSYIQLNEEIIPQNLVDFLCGDVIDSPNTFFIISGIQLVEHDDTLKVITNLLGLSDPLDSIQYKIGFLEPNSNNVNSERKLLIAFNEFSAEEFRKFCHNNSNCIVFWITLKQQKLFLNQIYNPLLYKSRHLKVHNKLVIEKRLIDELLKDDLNCTFFLSNTNESKLIELLSIPNVNKSMIKRNIQFYESEKEAEEKLCLLRDEKPFHWIHVENNELMWKCSNTCLKPITDNIDVSKSIEWTEHDFIKQSKHNSVVIISGGPGMGKSATLTKVYEMLQSSNWVIKIDLKNCLCPIDNLPSDEITVEQAVNFILRATKHDNEPLEKKIIKYKIEQGNRGKSLVLLFDGFDEVKDNSGKRKLIHLLKSLKDKVSVWITSREHEIKILQDSLFVLETRLREFTKEEQKEVLNQFWKISHLLILGGDKCKEYFETLNCRGEKTKFDIFTDSLFERVNKIVGSRNSYFIEIPLQLRLLAEGFQSEFFQFASSDRHVPDFSSIGLLSLFKRFIDFKLEIYLKDKLKISLVNNVSEKWFRRPVIKRHMRLSFVKLFGECAIEFIGEKPPFKKVANASTIYEADELKELYRVGLIHFTQNETFDFIHQTIAEYFASKFLIYLLKKPCENNKTLKALELLLTDILIHSQYKLIRHFINDFLCHREFPIDLLSSCGKIICKLSNESPEQLLNEDNETSLHIISKENYLNLLCFLLKSLETSSMLKGSIDFICLRSFNCESALFVAIKNDDNSIIDTFLCFIEGCTESVIRQIILAAIFQLREDKKKYFIHKILPEYFINYPKFITEYQAIEHTWNILYSFLLAVENGDMNEIQKILTEVSPEVHKFLLLMTDSDGNTLLHVAADNGKWETFENLITLYPERDLSYLMHIKNDAGKTVMNIIINKAKARYLNMKFVGNIVKKVMKKILEKDRVFLMSTNDSDGMSILHLAAEENEWDVIKSLINCLPKFHLSEIINLKNNRGNRVIDFATQKGSVDIVKYLSEKGANLFDQSVIFKPCIIHEAVCNENQGVLKFILDELHKIFAGETEKISHYVNAKDSKGDSPLMWASEKGNVSAVNELLAVKEININAVNNKGMTALDWAQQKGHTSICVILQDFMNCTQSEQSNNK